MLAKMQFVSEPEVGCIEAATVAASLDALSRLPMLTREPGTPFAPLPVSGRIGRVLYGEQPATRAAPDWQRVVDALLADPEAALPKI
jgi:hypothetical protein